MIKFKRTWNFWCLLIRFCDCELNHIYYSLWRRQHLDFSCLSRVEWFSYFCVFDSQLFFLYSLLKTLLSNGSHMFKHSHFFIYKNTQRNKLFFFFWIEELLKKVIKIYDIFHKIIEKSTFSPFLFFIWFDIIRQCFS